MKTNDKITVSVIIPYFQREKGILTKCIKSALNQKNIADIHLEILIIDDSSPIIAEDELSVFIKANDNIQIIRQPNTGPAGARNTGLNSISEKTKYVAFLDSDDHWEPNHISNAIKALEAGNDFYFSDFYQLNQTISAFNRAKRIDTSKHPLIFPDTIYLHQYQGNMLEQIVTGNIIGTPTVVYRLKKYPSLRFREDLVRAGEDYMFWMEFNQKSKIAFSSLIECKCGKGINIYSSAQYGTVEFLDLIYYETKYRLTTLKEFDLDKSTQEYIKNKIKKHEPVFFNAAMTSLIHGKLNAIKPIISYLGLNPISIINTLIYLMIKIKNRMKS